METSNYYNNLVKFKNNTNISIKINDTIIPINYNRTVYNENDVKIIINNKNLEITVSNERNNKTWSRSSKNNINLDYDQIKMIQNLHNNCNNNHVIPLKLFIVEYNKLNDKIIFSNGSAFKRRRESVDEDTVPDIKKIRLIMSRK